MEDCELFAPSAFSQCCARSAVPSYALGLQQSWGNGGLVYSSREGTAAWFTAVVREQRLDLQQSWGNGGLGLQQPWGNGGLGLQQPINSQLSMLVIVLHLMSTGSNLYSWEVHCFYLKVLNKALYGQNHCLLPIENSHNQSQQVKAWTAQKGSNLTEKFRRLQDIFG
jgi:hypothetical protein